MIAAFLSGAAGEAGKQWAARILGPALVFWTAGLALVWYDHHRALIARDGWLTALDVSTRKLDGLPPAVTVGLIPAAAVVLIVGSAVVGDRLRQWVLRLFEGYWPGNRIRELLIRRQVAVRRRAMASFQRIEARCMERRRPDQAGAGPSSREERDLTRALATLRAIPARPERTLPTRLGNVLHAAELRAARKHGVDAVTCWPRLWLVIPAETRDEVTQARLGMEKPAQTWLWGALFVAWTPWAWWAPLAALAVAVVSYRNCLAAARDLGALVEATFDVHLPLLYAATRIPPPPAAGAAAEHGELLSRYLLDGGAGGLELRFRDPEGTGDDAAR